VETLQSANSGMLEVEGLEPGAILQAQLAKLVVNSILNPLTALCGCKTGQLFNNQDAKTLYSRLLPEAGVIVRALLPREDLKDAFSDEALDALVMRVVRQVANNTSSMLQDIQAGRRTEIDYINRYLVTQAQRLGLPHAHHSAMCRAITLLEAKARRNADL
jgi:2-dehydropantoate 2-reductase